MVRSARLHRLPQRLDYTLIPPPLDLDSPSSLVDQKSPLPAIIVTPSSPKSTIDFSIAFLAPPPKPSLRQRLNDMLPTSLPSLPPSPVTTPIKISSFSQLPQFSAPFKARTIVIMFMLLIIMACHLITHQMAIQRPHIDFGSHGLGLGQPSSPEFAAMEMHDRPVNSGSRFFGGWLQLWELDEEEAKIHDFVVTEASEHTWTPIDRPIRDSVE